MWMFGSRTTVKKVRNSLTWFSHMVEPPGFFFFFFGPPIDRLEQVHPDGEATRTVRGHDTGR